MTCDWPTRHYRFGSLDSHMVTPGGIHPHRANQTGAELDWSRGDTCTPLVWCGCTGSAFRRTAHAWVCMSCGLFARHRIRLRLAGGAEHLDRCQQESTHGWASFDGWLPTACQRGPAAGA